MMVAAASEAAEPVIEIARATLRDLRHERADSLPLTLASTLDHDLGLDSLSRVELFTRIEEDMRVQLPDALFETAETLGDIAAALKHASVPKTIERRPAIERADGTPLAAAPPASVETLEQVLRWHVEHHPQFPQITITLDDREEIVTYQDLWRDACAIAGGLQKQRVQPREPVALMLPTSRDYFGAFFGTLLAGAVPVPLYPPARLSQIEEHVHRHAGILANAGANMLVTTPEMRRLATVLRMHAPSLQRIATAGELRALQAERTQIGGSDESDMALLQYTSGSTGQPKGVVLTHANVLANIRALGSALEVGRDDVFVSWLPLYHDMGLIGAWLGPLYFGFKLIVMSPLVFLARPLRWLEAIHRHRATMSTAPNFAYELCLKHVTETQLAGLDLSTWRIAMNGAEAVMPETLLRFQEKFARCGLRPTALTPVYGLAECSVGLAIPPLDRGPLIDRIERETFVQQGLARLAQPEDSNTLAFISCGRPLAGHQVRIIDDAGRELGERHEGRLEFRGPSATQRYYRNPAATSQLIHDGWLDTGDRAYLANGELYVTGRIKDIIIRAGRHIYPDELEAAVGSISGIRKGCVAVFGSTDRASGTERVIVLAETREQHATERERLRQAINAAVVQTIGEPPDDVVLAAPHTVLKTSSGKIRRTATREVYESGRYGAAQERSTSLQLLNLGLSGVAATTKRALRRSSDVLYGAYFWSLFVSTGLVALALTALPLSARARWRIGHHASRLFLRTAGVRLTIIRDPATVDPTGEVIVANHSSYLDGVVLAAAFPHPCRFVAKRELARTPLIGGFLQRLGAVFVERFDVRAGVEDARRLAKLVAHGESCIFFPEGTFVRAPRLLPFHLGAFTASVGANRPILPVALQGTRTLLPDQQWLPRRSPITVHIGSPIATPRGKNAFAATIQLRDAARRYILDHCGEPG